MHYFYPGYLGGCGHTEEIGLWMDQVQNSAVEDEDLPPFVPKKEDLKPPKAEKVCILI